MSAEKLNKDIYPGNKEENMYPENVESVSKYKTSYFVKLKINGKNQNVQCIFLDDKFKIVTKGFNEFIDDIENAVKIFRENKKKKSIQKKENPYRSYKRGKFWYEKGQYA